LASFLIKKGATQMNKELETILSHKANDPNNNDGFTTFDEPVEFITENNIHRSKMVCSFCKTIGVLPFAIDSLFGGIKQPQTVVEHFETAGWLCIEIEEDFGSRFTNVCPPCRYSVKEKGNAPLHIFALNENDIKMTIDKIRVHKLPVNFAFDFFNANSLQFANNAKPMEVAEKPATENLQKDENKTMKISEQIQHALENAHFKVFARMDDKTAVYYLGNINRPTMVVQTNFASGALWVQIQNKQNPHRQMCFKDFGVDRSAVERFTEHINPFEFFENDKTFLFNKFTEFANEKLQPVGVQMTNEPNDNILLHNIITVRDANLWLYNEMVRCKQSGIDRNDLFATLGLLVHKLNSEWQTVKNT
jgi:hypothetical protein